MWNWALIAVVIIAAVFLVVTLAHLEAGSKAKGKWLAFTLCSVAVVAGLVIFRPPSSMDIQAQHLPTPSSSPEQATDWQVTTEQPERHAQTDASEPGPGGGEQKQDAAAGAEPESRADGDEQMPGTVGQDAENPATSGAESVQDKEQSDYKPLNKADPVLEEILLLKRQAKEKQRREAAEKIVAGPKQDAGEAPGEPGGQAGKQADQGSGEESPRPDSSERASQRKVLPEVLNVRDKGGLDGRVIGVVKSGAVIDIYGESETGEWLKIKLSSGRTGWVNKKHTSAWP